MLVPFLAIKEALAPLANDSVMLGRSIRSFRHLKYQNPPIISDSIGIPRWLRQKCKKSEEQEKECNSYRRGYGRYLWN